MFIPEWILWTLGSIFYVLMALGVSRPLAFMVMDTDLRWWGAILLVLAVILWPVTLVVLIVVGILTTLFGVFFDV